MGLTPSTWAICRTCRALLRLPQDLDTVSRALLIHSHLQQETNSLLRETIQVLTQQPAQTPPSDPLIPLSLDAVADDARARPTDRNPTRLRTDRDVVFGPPRRVPTVPS